ncbi:Hpt domain-containing protein [Iningainema tapete]|nr:Hpt domain-containing protein [Iningainema tapete]
MFVEDTQSHLEITSLAIANLDFELLAKEAHHLKGSSANVGVNTMHIAAEKLEHLALKQERRGTTELICELGEFINRIQAFLTSSSKYLLINKQ